MKKKFFVCFIVILLLVVPFSILSSSAAETVYQPDVKVAFGDFAISDVMVLASRDNEFIDIDRITFLKLNDNRVRVNIIPEGEQFRHHDSVRVAFLITPTKSEYLDSSFNTIGSFSVGMKLDGMKNFKLSSLGSTMRQSSSTYESQSPEIEDITTHWGHYKRFHYLDRSKGYSFDSYYVSVEYTVVNTAYDYSRYIYVQDFDFDSLTGTEFDKKELNEVLTPHTDKIVNGWEGGHDVDGSAVNDYGSAEGELNSATQNAQSDSISFFNNFGNLFQDSHLHNGLLSVSAIFKEFFAVDWISSLLSFGLGLGAFAFILGSATLVISRTVSNQRREKYSKERSSNKKSKGGGG